jgi:hypothetical protein
MDPSDKDCPFGILPFQCLNQFGYVLSESPNMVPLYDGSAKNYTYTSVKLDWKPAEGMKGSLAKSYSGYAFADLKEELREEGEEKWSKAFVKERNAEAAPKISLNPTTAIGTVEAEVSYQPMEDEGTFYIDPLLGSGIKANPFLAEKREMPVDMGVFHDGVYLAEFSLPAGYKVESLPKGINATLPDGAGKFTYIVTEDGGKVKAMARISIKKTQFTPAEYSGLRNLYQFLISTQSERVVVKKV